MSDFDPSKIRLGKHPAKKDPRTLMLARYMAALAPPPPLVDWTEGIASWPMDANDRLGDCTCAAVAHLLQLWTRWAAVGPALILTDDQVIGLYEKVGAYNPADPSTDQGAIELNVLNFWKNTGVDIGAAVPDQIAGYASINVGNTTEVMQAIHLFGGIYAGVLLPLSAQSQVGEVWDVVTGEQGVAGSWGGHAIPIVGFDSTGLTCVTWGKLQKMTWAFFAAYVDEAYAIVTKDFIKIDGQSPSGFDLATLQSDLAAIV